MKIGCRPSDWHVCSNSLRVARASGADRVACGGDDDRDGRGGPLGRERCAGAGRRDELHFQPDELFGKGLQKFGPTVGILSLDEQILAVDPTELPERRVDLLTFSLGDGRTGRQQADPADGCRGLRSCRRRCGNDAGCQSAEKSASIRHRSCRRGWASTVPHRPSAATYQAGKPRQSNVGAKWRRRLFLP